MKKIIQLLVAEVSLFHSALIYISKNKKKQKYTYVYSLFFLLVTLVGLRMLAAVLLLWFNNYQVIVVVGFLVPTVLILNAARKFSLKLRREFSNEELFEIPKLFKNISTISRLKHILVSSLLLLIGVIIYGIGNGFFCGEWFRLPKGISLLHGLDGSCSQTNWGILKDFYYIGLSVPLQLLYFFVYELFLLYVVNTVINGEKVKSFLGAVLFFTAIVTFAAVHLTFGWESCIFSGCTLGVAHAYNILYKKDIISSIFVHMIFGSYAILIGWVDPNHWHSVLLH